MMKPIKLHPAVKKAAPLAVGTVALGVTFISYWEGNDPVAKHNYFDPKGVVTVCHGETNLDDPTIKVGMRFSKAECDALLAKRIPEYAYPIYQCIPAFKTWKPHRQIAWVSFGYNLGPGRVCNGTIGRLLKANEVVAACEHMTDFERAAGKELPGLVRRREDGFWGERTWCLRDD